MKLCLILTSKTSISAAPISIAIRGDYGIDHDIVSICWKLVRSAGKLDFIADDGYCEMRHFSKGFLAAIALMLVPG